MPFAITKLNRAFLRKEEGGVAIVFALAVSVLCICSGLAIDYGRATSLDVNLQKASDAAALAAAGLADADDDERQERAKKVFAANVADIDWMSFSPTVSVGDNTVTVQVATKLETTLMRVTGIDAIKVNTSATAALGQVPSDVYVVLDMSASLGIAADDVERQKLKDLTKTWIQSTGTSFAASHPNGCEFACHRQEGFEPGTETTYAAAKAAGIRLREDVLLDASKTLLSAVLDPSLPGVKSGDIRAGVIGFSNAASWLSKPTSVLSEADQSLATFPDSGHEDTLTDVVFPWINTETKKESQQKHRTIVLVTDGVTGGQSVGFVWSEVNTDLCDTLKQGGADLYVLEVKYEDLMGEPIFDMMVGAFYHRISPALQACASPGKYMSASTSTEIETSFSEIAEQIIETRIRLIN